MRWWLYTSPGFPSLYSIWCAFGYSRSDQRWPIGSSCRLISLQRRARVSSGLAQLDGWEGEWSAVGWCSGGGPITDSQEEEEMASCPETSQAAATSERIKRQVGEEMKTKSDRDGRTDGEKKGGIDPWWSCRAHPSSLEHMWSSSSPASWQDKVNLWWLGRKWHYDFSSIVNDSSRSVRPSDETTIFLRFAVYLLTTDVRQPPSASLRMNGLDLSTDLPLIAFRTEGKKRKLRNGYRNESTIFQDNKMGHLHSPFSWSRHRLTYIKVNELRAMECNTRIKSEEVVTCRVLNKQGKKIQTMGWENYWSLMFGLARISFPVFLPIHSQNRWVLIS